LRDVFEQFFILPAIPDIEKIIFHLIEIDDLFFSLSVSQLGELTPEYQHESARAQIAYLALYMPEYLPLKRPLTETD